MFEVNSYVSRMARFKMQLLWQRIKRFAMDKFSSDSFGIVKHHNGRQPHTFNGFNFMVLVRFVYSVVIYQKMCFSAQFT